MAAPQSGTMFFVGQSGTTYAVDMYHSDVVNAMVNWDGGGGSAAASPTFWIAPENVVLRDYSIVTGMTDTTRMRLTVNSKPLPSILRYALHETTLNNRPELNIGFRAGAQVGAIQLA
jgi:hypothetical protein